MNKTKKFLLGLISCLLAFVLVFCACSNDEGNGGTQDVAVTSITLNKSALTLEEGGSETLTATVEPSNATDSSVTWSSDDTSIATVESGTVTAISAGSAVITATAGGKSATCEVTVTAAATAATYTVTFLSNGGSSVEEQTVTEGSAATKPEDPTREGYTFDGWYADEALTVAYAFTEQVTGDITLYAKWTETTAETEYEWVSTQADFTDSAISGYNSSNKTSAQVTVGRFTYGTSVYFEDSSSGLKVAYGDINTQTTANAITFELKGEDNKNAVSFVAKAASSSNTCTLKLYKVGEDSDTLIAEQVTTSTTTAYSIGYDIDNDKAGGAALTAGTYYLGSSDGAVRLGTLVISEYVEKSEPVRIAATASNVNFLVGDTFNTTGLNVTVVYANGKTDALTSASYMVETDSVDTSKSGVYEVKVVYNEDENIFTAYTVYVYEVKSLSLSTFLTSGATTTSLKQVYTIGESALDTTALTVTVTAECTDGTNNYSETFTLSSSAYTVTNNIDFNTAGSYTVTVTSTANAEAAATYPVYVVSPLTVSGDNSVTITVDPKEEVSSSNFHTITDALTYLAACNFDSDVTKIIKIADGEYNEKFSVTIPNVRLVGSELSSGSISNTTDNNVVIWYDAIAGKTDPAGTVYGTNGSATVSITSAAEGFTAYNITFKNYYNTHELYTESLGISSDSQAVALLVEANKSSFFNCKLTSYHDTLYANKGWQYYYKCWIEGRTDYIFGSDAIAYFDNCSIWSIGAGASQSNGGYVVALKPSSSAYYFVFNGCTFDGDENVKDGSVALGRAWGADMKLVIINCTISGKFSTAAHTSGATSAQRYCTMSGNEPKAANMLEYNNTGDGAASSDGDIDYSDTLTFLTESKAAAYSVSSVFNGWTPTGEEENVTAYLSITAIRS